MIRKKLIYHIENRESFIKYLAYIIKIIPRFIVNAIEKRRGSITLLARKKV